MQIIFYIKIQDNQNPCASRLAKLNGDLVIPGANKSQINAH